MLNDLMTSFPRGKVGGDSKNNKKDHDDAKKTSKSHRMNDSDGSKKRRSSSAPAVKERDFLFGGTTEKTRKDHSLLPSKRSKKDGGVFDELAALKANATALSKSFLPIGGGGCVIPTSGPKSREGYIESLGFSKLSKGFKLLGICREVNDNLAIFSLPNMWTGYMLRPTVSESPPLTEVVSVNQIVSVVIVKAVSETSVDGPKRRIQVTCMPDACNHATSDVHNMPNLSVRGQILSVEDHGLLIDLGYQRKGFLAFEDIEGNYQIDNTVEDEHMNDNAMDHSERPRVLSVHRVMDFIVKSKAQTKIIPLKLPAVEKIASLQSITPTYKPTIQELQPGMLVQCLVEMTVKNGICVTFSGGTYRGSIEIMHFDKYWLPKKVNNQKNESMNDDWKSFYMEVGRSLIARIIAVDPVTKIIRLSLQHHLISLHVDNNTINNEDDEAALLSPSQFPKIGSIVKGCKVIRVDGNVGVLLALPDKIQSENGNDDADDEDDEMMDDKTTSPSTTNRAVYVHISKAIDEQKEDGKTPEALFIKTFLPGSKHTVRILSTNANLVENIASGATAKSIIDAHVLNHSDLFPGTLYKQVRVCNHLQESGSILVDFGLGIKGLINPFHMFDHGSKSGTKQNDYRSKVGKVKYAIGAKVDVRILYTDNVSKRCYVTAKKPLVKAPEGTVITSYDNVHIGQKALGFISKVDKRGLWVTFFNRVYGRVTARSLSSELGIDNPSDNYTVGDVVECRVVNIKYRNKHKKGSTKLSRSIDEEDDDVDHNNTTNHHDYDDEMSEADSLTTSSNKSEYFRQLTLSLKVDGETELFVAADHQSVDTTIPHPSAVEAGTASVHTDMSTRRLHLQAGIIPAKTMRVVELINGKEKSDDKAGHSCYVPGYAIVSIKAKYLFPEASSNSSIECKLSYDQLLDEYDLEWISSSSALDDFASKALTVGKKITGKGIILSDPKKSSSEYIAGTGRLVNISVRPKFVEYAEQEQRRQENTTDDTIDDNKVILPNPNTRLFAGAYIVGYVNQIHKNHGAFVRFLNNMSGLVPKQKGGLSLQLFHTMIFQVYALDDTVHPPKLSLVPSQMKTSGGNALSMGSASKSSDVVDCPFQVGAKIDTAIVSQLDFHRAMLKIVPSENDDVKTETNVKIRLHCTMAESKIHSKSRKGKDVIHSTASVRNVTKAHPFYGLDVGSTIKKLKVIKIEAKGRLFIVDVTNRKKDGGAASEVDFVTDLNPGNEVSGVVSKITAAGGLRIVMSPSLSAFVPPLEISDDIKILEQLGKHFDVGTRVTGTVINTDAAAKRRSKFSHFNKKKGKSHDGICVSLLPASKLKILQPMPGDLVVGYVNTSLHALAPPALMLELRDGFVGRCCITELNDPDSWENMPMSHWQDANANVSNDDEVEKEGDSLPVDDEHGKGISSVVAQMARKFVCCRVRSVDHSKSLVEVSLRPSRVEGDLEDDAVPSVGDTVRAYVVDTNKQGCFVRLSRNVEGRTILKELCDGFLPNPGLSFPPGRLVVGKVKKINALKKPGQAKTSVDLDMRESILVADEKELRYEDIEAGSKHKGTIQRIEEYGVFVRIHNTNITGLAHKSECSDSYVKSTADLFDAGNLVKVLVLKKDDEKKRVSLSLKAAHFEGDEDSDSDETSADEEETDSENENEEMQNADEDLGSDDDDFVEKLKIQQDTTSDSESDINALDDDASESSDNDSMEEDDDAGRKEGPKQGLDTDVGFDWGGDSNANAEVNEGSDSESSDEEEGEDDEAGKKTSHKSRKKQAQRRREEQEVSKRESALADGTADENPETADDFERLLAGEPNSSEIWIRYMAFHLTLADIQAARDVASRAFSRIDFRQEGEKLNVWCALLTLERKFGTDDSFQDAIDRACQNNNPKQVYLRICEICSREASNSNPDAIQKADEMYAKMCRKFKDKKKVWIAHMEYLLKAERYEEAYALSKRALLSLAAYKHVETMSKFAQLVFEFGQPDRARTLFDGILLKYPKRLDLFFVYVDKEVKHGSIEVARSLFERASDPTDGRLTLKVTDKQMKRLFKKWFSFEEEHGTDDTQERVKDAAREFVERIAT